MKDVIEINGVKYAPLSELAEPENDLQPVLIRSYAAGVHFGLLASEEFTQAGKVVVLKNSRRVHYWVGAASLSQMAVDGIGDADSSRVSKQVESIEVVNVIETIPLTAQAFENLKNQPVWEV